VIERATLSTNVCHCWLAQQCVLRPLACDGALRCGLSPSPSAAARFPLPNPCGIRQQKRPNRKQQKATTVSRLLIASWRRAVAPGTRHPALSTAKFSNNHDAGSASDAPRLNLLPLFLCQSIHIRLPRNSLTPLHVVEFLRRIGISVGVTHLLPIKGIKRRFL